MNKSKLTPRHKKALELLQANDDAINDIKSHITRFEKFMNTNTYKSNPKKYNAIFNDEQEKLHTRENAVYTQYYNHMHADFDFRNTKVDMFKYPKKFMDKKFVNDMYKTKRK